MAETPRLFFDANVLLAASVSAPGGSALAVRVCIRGLAKAQVTRQVLWEAERNLQVKFPPSALLEFYTLLGELEPRVVPDPSPAEIRSASAVVHPKDAHVLAGARAGKASHLLTLDRRHFLSAKTRVAILPIVVCTPGEFLTVLVS
ncbi:MAG: PIN domain-containing protein [Chloroflexi bacterium]|nr:PIN domain-containing protein [Chloroflexota bacterium]